MSGPDDSKPGTGRERPRPGDEAPVGTPGSAENTCRHCGGSGRMQDGSTCTVCEGTGLVTVEIGGG
jgi:DnaJ-class molecular chaperone